MWCWRLAAIELWIDSARAEHLVECSGRECAGGSGLAVAAGSDPHDTITNSIKTLRQVGGVGFNDNRDFQRHQ